MGWTEGKLEGSSLGASLARADGAIDGDSLATAAGNGVAAVGGL